MRSGHVFARALIASLTRHPDQKAPPGPPQSRLPSGVSHSQATAKPHSGSPVTSSAAPPMPTQPPAVGTAFTHRIVFPSVLLLRAVPPPPVLSQHCHRIHTTRAPLLRHYKHRLSLQTGATPLANPRIPKPRIGHLAVRKAHPECSITTTFNTHSETPPRGTFFSIALHRKPPCARQTNSCRHIHLRALGAFS